MVWGLVRSRRWTKHVFKHPWSLPSSPLLFSEFWIFSLGFVASSIQDGCHNSNFKNSWQGSKWSVHVNNNWTPLMFIFPPVKEEIFFRSQVSCQTLWYVTSEPTTHKGEIFPQLNSFPNGRGFISTEKGNCLHSSSHFKKVIPSFVYLMVLNTFTSIGPFELLLFPHL